MRRPLIGLLRPLIGLLRRVFLGGPFRRGFTATISFDGLSRICGAGSALILLRFLRVPDYAYLVLFLAVAQTLSIACTGGITTRYLRIEAERVSRGQQSTSGFLPVLALGVLFLVVFCIGGLAVSQIVGIGEGVGTRAAFWSGIFIYAVGQAGTELLIYHHQAQLAFRRAGQVNFLRSVPPLIVALLVALIGPWSGFDTSMLLAASVAVLAAILVYPVVRQGPLGAAGQSSLRGALTGTHWLTLFYLASAAYSNADILVVGAVLSKFDTAEYGAALRYYAIILGAVPALTAVFRVRTFQGDMVDSFTAQRRMLLAWMRRAGPIMMVVCAVAAILAPFLIPIVDRGRYPQSVAVFQILLVYALAVYVILPAPSLLMTRHRYALLALFEVATVVANVVGDIFAASRWGLTGVAVCASVVNVLVSIVITITVLRQPEPRPKSAFLTSRA
jgi:O-antigen/teichoic acid export membrane protein